MLDPADRVVMVSGAARPASRRPSGCSCIATTPRAWESAQGWRDATLDRFGALHGLVNVKAPLRLIRLLLPALRAGGDGRVVNVASLSGKRVANANVGCAMSKFALVRSPTPCGARLGTTACAPPRSARASSRPT